MSICICVFLTSVYIAPVSLSLSHPHARIVHTGKQKLSEGKDIVAFMTVSPAPCIAPDKEGEVNKHLLDEWMKIITSGLRHNFVGRIQHQAMSSYFADSKTEALRPPKVAWLVIGKTKAWAQIFCFHILFFLSSGNLLY